MDPTTIAALVGAGLLAGGGLTLGIVSVVKIAASAVRESRAHETTRLQSDLRVLSDVARQKAESQRDFELAAKVQAQAEATRVKAQNKGLQDDLLNAQAELAKLRTAGLDDPDPDVAAAAVAGVLSAPRP